MKRLLHYQIETSSCADKVDIYGMSRVGFIPMRGKTFEIYVNTGDPGEIPHFHLRDKDDWEAFHTCIRIDQPEYFHHGSKCDVLNSREKKALQQFMIAPVTHKYANRLNNWEMVCMLWDTNNSDVKIPEGTVQSDYTQL